MPSTGRRLLVQLSQELNLSARTTRTLPEDCTTALLACIRGVCCALCTLLDLATNVCVDEFVEFFLQAKARGSTYGETHTSLEHRWISNVPPALRDELVDLLMMGDLRLSSQVLALLQKLHRRQGSLLGAVQSLVFLEDPGLRGSFEERHTACWSWRWRSSTRCSCARSRARFLRLWCDARRP